VIDNNAAERAIRPISSGRKPFLFAAATTVIEIAKLSKPNRDAYLADILARCQSARNRDHDPAKLDDLLPRNWSSRQSATAKVA
jgi:transposase